MEEEIVTDVIWLRSADRSFERITKYLEWEWTDKEIEKFIKKTEEVLLLLKKHPEMSRPSTKAKNVRSFILNRHTKMFYRYKPQKKQIEVLLFWNMKQDPSKLKY